MLIDPSYTSLIVLTILIIEAIGYDGERYYVVQHRKNSVLGISTLKSDYSDFVKKAKSKHSVFEHFFKTNFDLLTQPKQPYNSVRLKMALNRELLSVDIFSDNTSMPVENCFYHGAVQKNAFPTIALSTCGGPLGLNGLLVRNNDTLWINPEETTNTLNVMPDELKDPANAKGTMETIEYDTNTSPVPHRLRLYDFPLSGTEKSATVSSFNFNGFQNPRQTTDPVKNQRMAPHFYQSSIGGENLRDHKLSVAIRIDSHFVDTIYRGNSRQAATSVLEAINIADLILQRLGLQLQVSSLKPWQDQRNDGNNSMNFSSTNPRQNLHRLIMYNKNRLHRLTRGGFLTDNVQSKSILVVFSGVAYQENVDDDIVGVPLDSCVPFSICSTEPHRSVIFIALKSRYAAPLLMASSFLHELSLALGMSPTSTIDSSCSCSNAWDCLASAPNGEVRLMLAPLLSCPYNSDTLHRQPYLSCLLPSSSSIQRALLGSESDMDNEMVDWHSLSMSDGHAKSETDQCGDGIVGNSEECDCKITGAPGKIRNFKNLRSSCTFDACCDHSTCLLHEWAQCTPSLPCCTSNCTLKSASTVCRKSKTLCDLPEVCTSLNGHCPPDRMVANGFFCLPDLNSNDITPKGICHQGTCRSHDVACQKLWGKSARSAHQKCYEASCGSSHCDDSVLCGQLECQDSSSGDISPKPNNVTFVVSNIHLSNEVIECRHLVRPSKIDEVPDWSPCGQGKVCHQKKCVGMHMLNVKVCPVGPISQDAKSVATPGLIDRATETAPCSGNGWCTVSGNDDSTPRCSCKSFYTGDACEYRLVAPGVWPNDEANATAHGVHFLGGFGAWLTEQLLLTAVVPFVILIFIAFAFFVICYNRKLILIKPKRKSSQSSMRRNQIKRMRSASSLKSAALANEDDDIPSPVLMCTKSGPMFDESEMQQSNDDGDYEQLVPPIHHAHLTRQPERGILKKKMVSPVQTSENNTLDSTQNHYELTTSIGIGRVDQDAAAASMAAIMQSFDQSARPGSESEEAALRHLSQQFGQSSERDDNDDEGEDFITNNEGVMQLASLRQIVAMRRGSESSPGISDAENHSNGNCPKPDVIQNTCQAASGSPSQTESTSGSHYATNYMDCNDPQSNQSALASQKPLEQLLNNIEQKFASTISSSGVSTLASADRFPTYRLPENFNFNDESGVITTASNGHSPKPRHMSMQHSFLSTSLHRQHMHQQALMFNTSDSVFQVGTASTSLGLSPSAESNNSSIVPTMVTQTDC